MLQSGRVQWDGTPASLSGQLATEAQTPEVFPREVLMSNAIGIVITDHIVAGRLEDQKLVGTLLRFPENPGEPDVLSSIPVGELVAMFCQFVTTLASQSEEPIDAIGIAVPGIVRHGIV